jgi:hypothetical protein
MVMESVRRDILAALLKRLFARGLIAESTYQAARNSLDSSLSGPKACLTEGATADGGSKNTG